MERLSKYVLTLDDEDKYYLFNSKNNVSISIEKELINKSKQDRITNEQLTTFLAENNFFQNKNELEEFSQVIEGREKERLQIIIFAHGDCNFRCKYCYENFEKLSIKSNVKKVISFIENKLSEGNFKFLQISWFGGEPLLGYREIIEISSYFIKYTKEKGIIYISDMTTNGYLLTPKIAKEIICSANVSVFQITVDGSKEGHDNQRILVNGHGTFDRIINNLQNLKNSNLQFNIILRFNVSAENYSNIKNFFKEEGKLFKDDNRFSFIVRNVGDWGQGDRAYGYEVERLEKDKVFELSKYIISKGYRIEDPSFYLSNYLGCYAQRRNAYGIDVHGNILKCTVALYDDKNKIGTLDSEIQNKKEQRWLLSNTEESRCRSCQLFLICKGGSCPKKVVFDEESFDNICRQMKERIYTNFKLMVLQNRVDYELKVKN